MSYLVPATLRMVLMGGMLVLPLRLFAQPADVPPPPPSRATGASGADSAIPQIMDALATGQAMAVTQALAMVRNLDDRDLPQLASRLVYDACPAGRQGFANKFGLEAALSLIADRQVKLLSNELAQVSPGCQETLLHIMLQSDADLRPVLDDVLAVLGATDDPIVWFEAANVLVRIGEPAIPGICSLLRDGDELHAQAALIALQRFANLDPAVVDEVIELLVREDWGGVRVVGVLSAQANLAPRQLARMGEIEKAATDEYLSNAIAEVMVAAGPVGCEELWAAMRSGTAQTRAGAVAALAGCSAGWESRALELLGDPDAKVRVRTIESFEHWPSSARISRASADAAQAAPAVSPPVRARIGDLLADESEDVRVAAAHLLGGQPPLAHREVQLLTDELTAGDAYLRWSATNALASAPVLSDRAIELLLQRLVDEDHFVRAAAAFTLAGCREHRQRIVEALIERLRCDINEATHLEYDRNRMTCPPFLHRYPLCFAAEMSNVMALYPRAAALALARIGADALPALFQILETTSDRELTQAIADTVRAMDASVLDELKQRAAQASERVQRTLESAIFNLEMDVVQRDGGTLPEASATH